MTNHEMLAIGRIDYANAWPLFHYVTEPAMSALGARIVSRIPAELNRTLLSGELAMSAVSSFAYARHAEQYLLLPDVSVSSVGSVHSILLFLKKPLDQVRKGVIAVTNASATSVNLLKVLMSVYLEGEPTYETMEPNLDKMLEHADAALLIGDPAIHASWRGTELQVIDLGKMWHDFTGLGMTYAVVAVRKEAAARHYDTIAAVHQLMVESKRKSLLNPELLVQQACESLGGEPDYWRLYFRALKYDFGERQQAGLRLYLKYATELNLLDREPELVFFK
ncbi:menaquinone biosynthesis protein [Paenibacillus sp. MMS18-CY102]|uniref:menaquinone biosynthesis protein n=1 Tax=Paenibacillus sp. MMS18-CY102 TaxID=2682849 RepID=UPI001365C5AD|nr:menaquinone biosynthesis protein [Paenibacillus sp. MMS18-CY102]MWC28468.1 ABC transporter substrate-binding protein [Paenibacillus sp. MMS18-CY102]